MVTMPVVNIKSREGDEECWEKEGDQSQTLGLILKPKQLTRWMCHLLRLETGEEETGAGGWKSRGSI